MHEDADWTRVSSHMLDKHGVTIVQANEAFCDPERAVIHPDYNSRTGLTDRIIGYSPTFDDLLTIIVLPKDVTVYGVNGWRSNSKDRRLYNEA